MARRRGGASNGLEAWPGYVDALSTLLMVIIFVLLVFVLAQGFLSVALSGRDQALDRVNRQMAELSDMLSLERGRSAELRLAMAQLNRDVTAATTARDSLAGQLAAALRQTQQSAAERDAAKGERDTLAARLADAEAQAGTAADRTRSLQTQIADQAGRSETAAEQLAATQAQLALAQRQAAELEKTVAANRATIELRLADLARLAEQTRALTALRDDLERQAQDAAAKTVTEQQRRAAVEAQLSDEKKFSDSARAQIALLNRQVEEMRAQLAQVSTALGVAEKTGRDKDAQIVNLGQRLNTALAARVEELQRYRSEFFGKLRDVLANRPGVQIVGDRFVFQSEVLFPVGSADMTQGGQDQITALAGTLKQIAGEIPQGLPWILRVDGHADRQPVSGGQFASNWELSAERAINVVKRLIADGVPATHLAATAFADNQPLSAGSMPDDFAKNRRIELRLTDR